MLKEVQVPIALGLGVVDRMFAREIGMLKPAARHEIDDNGQRLLHRIKVNALHVPRLFNSQSGFKQFVLHERTSSEISPFLTPLPTQNSNEAY